MTVDEVLDLCLEADVKALHLSFELEQSHVILLDKYWVGVNVTPSPNMIVESVEGSWSCGHIRKEN